MSIISRDELYRTQKSHVQVAVRQNRRELNLGTVMDEESLGVRLP